MEAMEVVVNESTNGKTVHADNLSVIDGFSGTAMDKKQVLAWLFGVRREMSTKKAGSVELANQLQGAQSAVNTFIRVVNSGMFDMRKDEDDLNRKK